MTTAEEEMEGFQARLGYRFRDPALLQTALTHRSYANERGLPEQYERLEFLGDSVLGLVAAEWLYGRYPDRPEGQLSKSMSYLVSEPVLAAFATDLELGQELRLGVGEERSGGRSKRSLLSDAMEAVLGAVFLDGGLEAARQLAVTLLEAGERRRDQLQLGDAKTDLQELTQAQGQPLPRYEHVGEEGPDHEKLFLVECWLEEEHLSSGRGRSKKIAEQEAATAALKQLIDS